MCACSMGLVLEVAGVFFSMGVVFNFTVGYFGY